VAMLDLDHFKAFNDEHGHIEGDALLEAVADAWTVGIRPTDTIARYGGEEFALLLPDCSVDAATVVIERLRELMPRGQNTSAGLACWDREESPIGLITRADERLYEAKARGRDQLVAVG
jgi:diguanylate cyclase (GGDEF)-like protein